MFRLYFIVNCPKPVSGHLTGGIRLRFFNKYIIKKKTKTLKYNVNIFASSYGKISRDLMF